MKTTRKQHYLLSVPIRRYLLLTLVLCTLAAVSAFFCASFSIFPLIFLVALQAAFSVLFCMGLRRKQDATQQQVLALLSDAETHDFDGLQQNRTAFIDWFWRLLDPFPELFLLDLEQLSAAKRNLENKEYQTTLVNKELELSTLQSQINPHFLYNTLESIRGAAIREGATAVAEMTEKLSYIFRYSISKAGKIVTVREALKTIDYYIAIQNFRFSGKIEFENNIKDEAVLDCQIPTLSLQPIVENAVFHGLEEKVGKGRIIIDYELSENGLLISVRDNGVGISPVQLDRINNQLYHWRTAIISNPESGTGIALCNINKRLKLQYGEAHGITLMSTVDVGTTVFVHLPILTG